MFSLFFATMAIAQNGSVTVAEVNAVINKVDAAVRKSLDIKPGTVLPTSSNNIATKSEIIQALDKLFEFYRPRFQYTPRPYRVERQVIEKFNSDQAIRLILLKFVKFGCTGTVSPLVVGAQTGMSPLEFGDTIGLFAAQIAAMTYFADPLHVPNIQRTVEKDGKSNLV